MRGLFVSKNRSLANTDWRWRFSKASTTLRACPLTLSATCHATSVFKVAAQRLLCDRASSLRIRSRTAIGLPVVDASPYQPIAGLRTSSRALGAGVSPLFLWRFTMNTTSNEKSYFDLHTSGIGYLQRIREVPVRGGRRAQPFLACTVAAMFGSAKDPSYRYFDVKVSGSEAKKLVQRYIGIEDQRQRPLIRFRIGDLWGDAYIRPKGQRKGEAAANLKGRLLKAELVDRAELALIEKHELITRGIGYLNRPKEVTPRDRDPFLSCSIAALAGPVDEPEYRYIDAIVTTQDAQHLVRRCVQAIESERRVLIAFRLNDMKADPYIRTKGEHAGEAAASLQSTLVHIGLIKIDGQRVYPPASVGNELPPAVEAHVSEADESSENVTTTETAEREPEVEVEDSEPAMAASF